MIKNSETKFSSDGPHGTLAQVLDNRFKVSEFKLQPQDYFPFWINILAKGMEPYYPLPVIC